MLSSDKTLKICRYDCFRDLINLRLFNRRGGFTGIFSPPSMAILSGLVVCVISSRAWNFLTVVKRDFVDDFNVKIGHCGVNCWKRTKERMLEIDG